MEWNGMLVELEEGNSFLNYIREERELEGKLKWERVTD